MNPRTAWGQLNSPTWRVIASGIVVGVVTATACGSYTTIDDYRECAVVIRGTLSAEAPIDAGTQVHVSAIEVGYVDGVTVDVASNGTFDVRPSSFGVGSFDADLRFVVEGGVAGAPFVRETTLTDVRFWEDRDGQQPDTVALVWAVSAP